MEQESERYCQACLQSLRGVVSCRCPECGRPFDPNEPTTTQALPYHGNFELMVNVGRAVILGFGILAALAFLHSATAFSFERSLGPMMYWLCGFPLALALGVVFVLSQVSPAALSRRMRVMGILFPLLFLSIALWNWPLYVCIAMHRPWLNSVADQVQASGVSQGAGLTGVYRYRQVRILPNGNVGFQLSGDAGGGTYLVRSAAAPGKLAPPGQAVWNNTNWVTPLGGNWYLVYED